MPHRLLQIILPGSEDLDVWHSLLPEIPAVATWEIRLADGQSLVNALVPGEEIEALLDLLDEHLGQSEGFRVVLLPVEAIVPRPDAPTEEPAEEEPPPEKRPLPRTPARLSREELHQDITDSTRLNTVYIVMVILSAVVAAVGLLRDNVALIIGAMVIAPLLGPNVSLGLATTLGDLALARKSLAASGAGIAAALMVAFTLGLAMEVDPLGPEIASRTVVGLGDIALALAAGCAGALAFTSGLSTTLVGVMVAVALLPPLMTFGMLLAAGHLQPALGSFLLLLTNLICVNLAAVVTFLVQGIHPATWWEQDRARVAHRLAVTFWTLLLLALIILIILSRPE